MSTQGGECGCPGPGPPGVPIVRNSEGVRAPFSLDRFARTLALTGVSLDEARATGRALLADLAATEVREATTDDLRHWLAERDPLVFARRRSLRTRGADGGWRYSDRALGRIAEFADAVAGPLGRAVHELQLDYFRPGASGILFDRAPGEEPRKAPPLEDLEHQLGDDADAAKVLDPDQLGSIGGSEPDGGPGPGEDPPDADFTKPGSFGRYRDPWSEWARRWRSWSVYAKSDGTIDGFGDALGPADCGRPWILYTHLFTHVNRCGGTNFAPHYRAALLQGIAEAYRRCVPTRCEKARVWILYAGWACTDSHDGGPLVSVFVHLGVVCTAL